MKKRRVNAMKGLFCARSVFVQFFARLLFVAYRKYVFIRTAARWKYINVGLMDFRNGTKEQKKNGIEK